MATKKTVTPWVYQGELFNNPDNKFGYIYLVTCIHPECSKLYIGRKFFYTNWGKKTLQKDSDWRTYKTSSKYVNEAITKYGAEYFVFEILQLFDTRAGVVSGEVEVQWAAQVLHAVDDNGERLYWNQAIGNIKFICREHSDEAKTKMSKARLGVKRGPLSEETKLKIGLSKLGNTNLSGYVHTPEALDKMSLSKKGQPRKHKVPMSEAGKDAIRESNKRRGNKQKKPNEETNPLP